ncbi:YciI family protein [Burkholderia ambifaria]|uniref:YciI family protein n=1 Tax=Burkholderia ambifaria TaxID=152480 RepID=UPI001C93351F|nr:YciI family protein [Burkholderia ambifaria]MBY4765855.1 YciI family protein [Burkholderia ambifaria]
MRFMIMIRANAVSESDALPDNRLVEAMTIYHEELAKAGVLLDANGLRPSARGWRVHYTGGRGTVIDGPFAETKELIAGYTLIQVRSRDEALEWTRRFPAPFGAEMDCEIEVRPLFELDDLTPSDAVERFRELQVGRGQAV